MTHDELAAICLLGPLGPWSEFRERWEQSGPKARRTLMLAAKAIAKSRTFAFLSECRCYRRKHMVMTYLGYMVSARDELCKPRSVYTDGQWGEKSPPDQLLAVFCIASAIVAYIHQVTNCPWDDLWRLQSHPVGHYL